MAERDKHPIPPSFDRPGDATARLVEMFIGMAQKKRIELGQRPAERAVFRKLHGVAHARFEPLPDAPTELRVGLFAQGPLAAWVRFSSDTSPTSPDLETTVGVGIKLYGVSGPKAFGAAGNTADLIMQNFPVFFVDNAQEMVEFTYAGVVQGDYPGYLAKHPKTKKILDAMQKVEGSVLTTTYWGILPFRLGNEVVKYRLEPTTPPQNVPDDAPDYLETDLRNRLALREYGFVLSVQRRTNPKNMPLDQATVEWPVEESAFVPLARLTFPAQDVWQRGQSEYGQALSYNIWRVPEANAPSPESSIAVVRRAVYAAGAETRHRANGQPLDDAPEPRTPEPPPPLSDATIVKAVIYPSIGVARVGNSPDGFFIGPEVPDPAPEPPGAYRDSEGRLKRQAARFRIYGVNATGQIIRELSGPDSDAEVRWSVQLANTKAAWYAFELALDIPEAAAAPPTTLRNATVSARAELAITPSSKTVHGKSSGPQRFDDGKFMGRTVYLGEVRTDEHGRLLVLGGHGHSASYNETRAITFANNEGWHDDVSDGPVTAAVKLNGVALDVVPAWVVVAPPNYGPQRKSVRTMWDLMRSVAIQAGTLPCPERPSFTFDILPIFERLQGLQWVNAGFAAGFGFHGAFNLNAPGMRARLADNGPASRELRKVVANNFRVYETDPGSPVPWPWLYGDAMNIPPVDSPRQYAELSDTQLAMLQQWAAGDFEADYDERRPVPRSIDEVPMLEQGDTLTRAALEFCLADAFHPGCEITWPVRASTMYMAPFRIAHAPEGTVEPALGEVLTADGVTIPNGPLYKQRPGGLTRWMAVPWQTDTASCRSGYDKSYDPYVPSFWPARVPNQVLTLENYTIVMDEDRPLAERRAAFANRAAWIEPLGSTSYTDQINNMIRHFDHLGVVEVRPGPKDVAEFPPVLEVEDQHRTIQDAHVRTKPGTKPALSHVGVKEHAERSAADVDLSDIEKVRRFPRGLR